MSHIFLARGAAAAAVIGMLSVSAPALAQTTTQGTTPTTQSTTPATPTNTDQKVTGRSYAACRNTIVAPGSGQAPVSGTTPNNQSTAPSTGNSESAPVNTANNGTMNGGTAVGNRGTGTMDVNGKCKNATTNGTNATSTTNPMNATPPATTMPAHHVHTMMKSKTGGSYGTQPTMGSNQGTMTNTLTDNPNGAGWLRKFNRPAVIAKNRNHKMRRTNALGTTTPPRP